MPAAKSVGGGPAPSRTAISLATVTWAAMLNARVPTMYEGVRSRTSLKAGCWRAALTMRVQAAYMILFGTAVIVMPHQLCALAETLTLGWFHSDVSRPDLLDAQYGAITGFFYVYLGTFYFALARLEEFARYTLISRTVLVPGLNLALIVFGKQHPRLFLFSAVDIGLATWTYSVLPPDLGPISIRT